MQPKNNFTPKNRHFNHFLTLTSSALKSIRSGKLFGKLISLPSSAACSAVPMLDFSILMKDFWEPWLRMEVGFSRIWRDFFSISKLRYFSSSDSLFALHRLLTFRPIFQPWGSLQGIKTQY